MNNENYKEYYCPVKRIIDMPNFKMEVRNNPEYINIRAEVNISKNPIQFLIKTIKNRFNR